MKFLSAAALTPLAFIAFVAVAPRSAAAAPLKVCNDAGGQFIAKRKCPKGGTLLSGTAIAGLLSSQGVAGPKGPQGDAGDQGSIGKSDIVVSDGAAATSIPPCIPDLFNPINVRCLFSGTESTKAQCPNGTQALIALCVDKPTNGVLTVYAGFISGDGDEGECTHYNNTFLSITGTFYTRLVCMPLPAIGST